MPKWSQMAEPSASPAPSSGAEGTSSQPFAPPTRDAPVTEPSVVGPAHIDVVARHAITGVEVKVTVPRRAKFKHVKRALAIFLNSDEIETRGQLMMKRDDGIYVAHKDHARVGEVRELLVVCTDVGKGGQVSLSEGEVSAEEEEPITQALKTLGQGVVPKKKPPQEAPKRIVKPGSLTSLQALALQRELYERFSADAFQADLARLHQRQSAGALSQPEFLKERQELFLTVQSVVLPSYGFEGTSAGVYKMMAAMGPHVKNKEFVKLANEINDLLGVNLPPETWSSLSKSCQKFDQQVVPKMRPVKPLRSLQQSGPGRPAGGLAGIAEGASASSGSVPSKEELGFETWPAARNPPYALFVAGSWTDWRPDEMQQMQWEGGLFITPVTVGDAGFESFQLFKDGKPERCIYPDRPDANPYEDHKVCGPDSNGSGKDWKIGKVTEDAAVPGSTFVIIAIMDKMGKVRVVAWQPI